MKTLLTTISKRNVALILVLSLISCPMLAQVGVGTLTPDASAQLDITSTNKGLLIPRMNTATRTGITSPATGLLVYQTDGAMGFYYFDGTNWNLIGSSALPGFSGSISTTTVSSSSTLTGWSTTAPFYTTTGFNPTTGQFTVPSTGTYAITATINYKTSSAITVSLGSAVNPYFEVVRTSPSNASLLQAYFPVLDVNVALVLTLRTILGAGVMNIGGTINLTAGDVIQLNYNANGNTVSLNLGGGLPAGIVWTVTRIK